MAKRIIGILFALLLVVGLMAVTVLAEEAVTPEPPKPAVLKVTTGDNTTNIVWEPEITQGMTPAYAKTTAEGALVLEGATEADYNLKVEWPAGGKPTLTMKNATLANNTAYKDKDNPVKHTIQLDGTEDFVILVKGTNVINGKHDTKPTTTAEYRLPRGINAQNEGTLTIKGDSKADSLKIDNYGGAFIQKAYNALTIESLTFYAEAHQTKSNAQFGIMMNAKTQACLDKTNFTVLNCDFTMEGGKDYSTTLIRMSGVDDKLDGLNTGDILFKNSKVRMYRSNSTGSTQDGSALIRSGANNTITFDRCDVLVYARHIAMLYAPAVLNCKDVQNVSQNWGTQDYAMVAGTKVVKGDLGKLTATHVCGTANDDFDCTTAEKCDMCGETVNAAQAAHKAEDDGDCTTAVVCTNAGCKKVITAAQAAHKPAADDGDCTTAVVCTNAGCKKVTTEAKASHTSPADRKDCNTPANCTVCNKALAVGVHTGGTATCKDKAVCAVCKQAYGELGACAPAADDGDCTTAIKCTVCGKETTAAKEHKFTNDKDTACDNEGCKHTRTISSNPNTGDISILLTAAVALSSAAGFAGVTVLRKKEN